MLQASLLVQNSKHQQIADKMASSYNVMIFEAIMHRWYDSLLLFISNWLLTFDICLVLLYTNTEKATNFYSLFGNICVPYFIINLLTLITVKWGFSNTNKNLVFRYIWLCKVCHGNMTVLKMKLIIWNIIWILISFYITMTNSNAI